MRRQALTEVELSRRWRDFKVHGSSVARAALIEHYQYLPTATLRRMVHYLRPGLDRRDLEQCGLIALIGAIDHFDASRQTKFRSYALSSIRGAVLEYLRREDWVPRSVRAEEKNWLLAERELREWGLNEADDKTKADALQLPLDAFYTLQAAGLILKQVSLEEIISEEGFGESQPILRGDTLEAGTESVEAIVVRRLAAEELAKAVGNLPPNEQQTVWLYYYRDQTFAVIGGRLRLTASRICQIHRRATQRLREDTGRAFDPAAKY